MIENANETDQSPKEREAYWYSPKHERPSVPAGIGRRYGLGGVRLADAGMEGP